MQVSHNYYALKMQSTLRKLSGSSYIASGFSHNFLCFHVPFFFLLRPHVNLFVYLCVCDSLVPTLPHTTVFPVGYFFVCVKYYDHI